MTDTIHVAFPRDRLVEIGLMEMLDDLVIERLTEIGFPPPWRLNPDEPGEIVAANGRPVLVVDQNRVLGDGQANEIAAMVALAINDKAQASALDNGVDPTTRELLKPRGNDGIVSPEICFNALLVVGDVGVTEAQVAAWTQDERDRTYDWAMRVHLHASDNDDVFVPDRPMCVTRPEPTA